MVSKTTGNKQSEVKIRKLPSRQYGTIGWIIEHHLMVERELNNIASLADVDLIFTIRKITGIQSKMNEMFNRHTVTKGVGISYKDSIIRAIDMAILRCDAEDGIPNDLRDSWRSDIQLLRTPEEMAIQIGKLSDLSPEKAQTTKTWLQNVAEIGEPFLRQSLKEVHTRIRDSLIA